MWVTPSILSYAVCTCRKIRVMFNVMHLQQESVVDCKRDWPRLVVIFIFV